MDSLLRILHDDEDFETAVQAGVAVLYKHSNRCFMCRRSLRQMEQFAEGRPDVPVYIIDVVAQRDLSSSIADRFGVRHESPQVILVRDGSPVWDGSHSAVSAGSIGEQIDRLTETD